MLNSKAGFSTANSDLIKDNTIKTYQYLSYVKIVAILKNHPEKNIKPHKNSVLELATYSPYNTNLSSVL